MPKVSVIIPLYNSSKYMSETMDSVLAQTYQDFEIILVDDGSTDSSKEIAQCFVNKFPEKIRYIYQENKGIAGARNTGIKNAGGRYIAFIDADDKWHPLRLEECVKAIESPEGIGLVHTDVMKISKNGGFLPITKRDKKHLSGFIFDSIFLRQADIYCLTVLFRKECCDRVGLLDENRICMGVDDKDLWLRISKEYKIAYIDKVLGYWRCHENNYSKNYEPMVAARLYVLNKFKPKSIKDHILRWRGLCRIYKEAGDKFLFAGIFGEARKQYALAFLAWPFDVWPLINYVKALFKARPGNAY